MSRVALDSKLAVTKMILARGQARGRSMPRVARSAADIRFAAQIVD
jgi:hypothetical protein